MHKHTCFLSSLLAACSSVSDVNLSSQDSEEELKSSFTMLKKTKKLWQPHEDLCNPITAFLYLKCIRKIRTKVLAGTISIGHSLKAFLYKRVN